jgi:hypothetical protein
MGDSGGQRRGERREEREREGRRERSADRWAPLPSGIHVSKTGHQNHPMVKMNGFKC